MKQLLLQRSIAMSLMALCCFWANAQTPGGFQYEVGNLMYMLHDDGTAEVVGYEKPMAEVVIPEKVEVEWEWREWEYTVNCIGEECFKLCEELTSVTIPQTVKSIKYEAFAGCSNLQSINLPDSLTSLGSFCFEKCHLLTSITLPKSLTKFEEGLFSYCGFTSFEVPNYIAELSSGCFSGCPLTSIVLPPNITEIPYECFLGTKFTHFTVPPTVTKLGYSSFAWTPLQDITIPNSVKEIKALCFKCCKSLTTLTIPESVEQMGWSCFKECENLKSVTMLPPSPPENQGLPLFEMCPNFTTIYVVDEEARKRYKALYPWNEFKILLIGEEEENPPTDIYTPTEPETSYPAKIYNLNGCEMKGELQQLPHGVYIMNGQKIIK